MLIVEHHKGEPASFMTTRAAELIADLPIVPVTTRSLKQYRRIRLPGVAPRFAVAGNGGHLLVDGVPDQVWAASIAARLAEVAPLSVAVQELQAISRPDWRIRDVDGLFCYAVLDRGRSARPILGALRDWAGDNGWTTSLQGRKLYLVPAPLTKAAAVAEVAARTSATAAYAAGDSLLDIDLLEYADEGLHPGHGELAESGWAAPHVRRLPEQGALAGQRIVEWFATVFEQHRSADGATDAGTDAAIDPAIDGVRPRPGRHR